MTANAGHVFVSHSSDNRELANDLTAFLEARGARIWIAPRDVRPGMDYSEQLQLAIENSVAFVVLVTDMANKSPYVRAETEMAFSTHKPIFPVRMSEIQPAAGLALFLKIRHWTDAYGPRRDENLERLASELRALSGAPAEATPPAATPVPAPPPPPPPPPQSQPAPPPVPVPPPDSPDEEKWRLAIGPNATWYLDRWRQMAAKGSSVNWNWAACLLSMFWFAYRKMWVPMFGFLLANVALAAVGAANPASGQLTLILSILLSFVTGSFGNLWYRNQTARLVAEASALNPELAEECLRRRGGVSVVAVVVTVGVVVVFTAIAVLAAAAQLQQQQQTPLNGFAPTVGNGMVDPEQGQPGDKPPADEQPAEYYDEGY